MQYDAMRHFADTWGLVMLGALFIGALIFVMRPGSSQTYARLSKLPLEGEGDL